MTIKELKAELKQRIKEENKSATEAVSSFGTGLHIGHSLGLEEALYYLTYLEGYNEESND